jgi:hypothetical protein
MAASYGWASHASGRARRGHASKKEKRVRRSWSEAQAKTDCRYRRWLSPRKGYAALG